jgi:hypothetical protein
MGNEIRILDPQKVIAVELLRNYILAGKKINAPGLPELSEQAGAILQQNAREPRPIPPGLWEDLFTFARHSWGFPGWSELVRAWEGDPFRVWQAERRKQREKGKEPQTAPEDPTESPEQARVSWLAIWLEAYERGDWVPDFILEDLRRDKKI